MFFNRNLLSLILSLGVAGTAYATVVPDDEGVEPAATAEEYTEQVADFVLPDNAPDLESKITNRVRVDLELVLLVDVSGSVDPSEYRLQLEGYANAFRDSALHEVIESREGVVVSMYMWSAALEQAHSPWFVLRTAEDCERLATYIDNRMDQRPFDGKTIMAQAIRRAVVGLERNRFDSDEQIIDISGDGICENWWYYTNEGTTAEDPSVPNDRLYGFRWSESRALAAYTGTIINGISIGKRQGLADWYAEHVPMGENSFTMHADDFEQFGQAIKLKLLMELQSFLRTSHD